MPKTKKPKRKWPTIEQLIQEMGVPEGYERLKWDEVEQGQQVWIWAQHLGKPMQLGPHTIVDVKARTLANSRGWKFMEGQESLLRPTTHVLII